MMETMYRWRCLCQKENPAKIIECVRCGKMRWIQIGFGRAEVLGVLGVILPGRLLRTIRKTA